MSDEELTQILDEMVGPRNGTWGYWLSYILMVAVLATLSLTLLVVGVSCEIYERALDVRTRRRRSRRAVGAP